MNSENKLRSGHGFINHLAGLIMAGKTQHERISKLRFNWASGVVQALYPPRVDIIEKLKPGQALLFVQTWKITDNDYHKRLTEIISDLGGWPVYMPDGSYSVDPLDEVEKDRLELYLTQIKESLK